MAFSTSRPSKSSRAKRSNASGYQAALSGFSSSLSDLRKTLIEQQVAQMDYYIEVNAASLDDKISLYENYLNGLESGTAEYFRVATKIQNLKDQASNEDFALAKSMYANNQITSEEYYAILKQRASEKGLSAKEKQTRLLELQSFEYKAQKDATDQQLRDAALLEDQGLLSASQRLSIIEEAYNNETDPNRKANLKVQLVTQRDKVYKEGLTYQELLVKQAITAGTATKKDLLPILVQKVATAKTETDALKANMDLQALISDIKTEDAKKSISVIDKAIETAQRTGDITTLKLAYDAKAGVIEDFLNDENVPLADKQKEQGMFSFLKNVMGKDVDVETGSVIDVVPTDKNNIQIIEDALANPDSSALIRTTSPDGKTAQYNLVRGTKTQINNPDGTIKSYYDFGNNIVLSRLDDPNLYPRTVDENGNPITDANGNVAVASLPTGRTVQKLPDNISTDMQQGNVKPLPNTEFKNEYVDLYQDQNGNMVKGYIVYGDKFKDVFGSQPLPGRPGAYVLTTKDNSVPTQSYVSENRLGGFSIQDVGKNIVNSVIGATGIGQLNSATATQQKMATGASLDLKPVKLNIPEIKIPNINSNSPALNVGRQLLNGVFSNNSNTPSVLTSVRSGNYGAAAQGVATNILRQMPGIRDFNLARSLYDTGKSLYNSFISFVGGNK